MMDASATTRPQQDVLDYTAAECKRQYDFFHEEGDELQAMTWWRRYLDAVKAEMEAKRAA